MDEKDEEEILIKEFGVNSAIWRLIMIEYACKGTFNIKSFVNKLSFKK